jgi:hypothetical protein
MEIIDDVFSNAPLTESPIGSVISAGNVLLNTFATLFAAFVAAFFALFATFVAAFFALFAMFLVAFVIAFIGAATNELIFTCGAVLLGAFRFEFILLDNSIDCYNVFPFILTIINA